MSRKRKAKIPVALIAGLGAVGVGALLLPQLIKAQAQQGTTEVLPPPPAPIGTTGNLNVIVLSSASNSPLPQSVVTLDDGAAYRFSKYTDQNGSAAFGSVPAKSIKLTVISIGYNTHTEQLDFTKGVTPTLTIKMIPTTATAPTPTQPTPTPAPAGQTGSVEVKVVQLGAFLGTNPPISEALVSVVGAGLTTRADVNGIAFFSSVPAGTYNINASKTGYNSQEVPINVVAGQKTTVTVALSGQSFLEWPKIQFPSWPVPPIAVVYNAADTESYFVLADGLRVQGIAQNITQINGASQSAIDNIISQAQQYGTIFVLGGQEANLLSARLLTQSEKNELINGVPPRYVAKATTLKASGLTDLNVSAIVIAGETEGDTKTAVRGYVFYTLYGGNPFMAPQVK